MHNLCKKYYFCLMINIKDNRINAEDLHSQIKSKTRFSDWISRRIEEADLVEGKDFYSKLSKSTGGRPKVIYEFSIDAAKEVALLEKNEDGKKIRRYLIGLSNKVEDGDLLNREQILYLTKLKTVFKYIENCEEAQKLNMSNFVNGSTNKYVYSDFHKMRNNILKLDKETIDKRIKDFCIENNKNYIGKTKNDALLFLDKYEIVRNGVWDFLNAAGHKQSMKLAELVKDMMRIESGEMYNKNEDNLFQKKEIEGDIKRLQ